MLVLPESLTVGDVTEHGQVTFVDDESSEETDFIIGFISPGGAVERELSFEADDLIDLSD